MKKSLHITFLCLFLLTGVYCFAGCNKNRDFASNKIGLFHNKMCNAKLLAKQEINSTCETLDKLHKKHKFFDSYHNDIARLSKCYNFNLNFGSLSSSKFIFDSYPELHNFSSGYSNNSFSKGKLISFFYSFQAFW